MKFTLASIVAFLPLLAAVANAAPASYNRRSTELSEEMLMTRQPTEYIYDDLTTRAKKKLPAPGPHANTILNTQKAQVARKTAKDKNAAKNQKVLKAFKKPVHDKKAKTPADKAADKKRGQAMTKAMKDHKAKNTAWHAAGKKTPEQVKARKAAQTARRADRKAGKPVTPPAPHVVRKKSGSAPKPKERLTPAQKATNKAAFKDANAKLRATQKLPGRKDTYTVGKTTVTGKDVRQGIFNTHLHKARPIGDSENKNPKVFENRPYSATHPTLAGQKAIKSKVDGQIYENPLKKSHQGHISGTPGAARVMTYEKDGKSKFKVMGHDTAAGGDASDHYKAKHTPAKRDFLEVEDFEDWE